MAAVNDAPTISNVADQTITEDANTGALGVTVARFEQPWRTAGGRVAVAPPRLDIGWRAGIERQPQGWRLIFFVKGS